jgi:hypothetical protein
LPILAATEESSGSATGRQQAQLGPLKARRVSVGKDQWFGIFRGVAAVTAAPVPDGCESNYSSEPHHGSGVKPMAGYLSLDAPRELIWLGLMNGADGP